MAKQAEFVGDAELVEDAGLRAEAEAAPAQAAWLRRSPLQHLTAELEAGTVTGTRAVRLRELKFLTMVGVRIQPDSDAGARITAAAGIELPGRSGQASGDPEATAVIWQGPDEFLLVAPERSSATGTNPASDLAAALGASEGAVVDLSANRTTLELSGPSARPVLEKGCALDLHPRVFGPGSAVSTQLGPVPVILWQTAAQTYRVMPRASFAEYVAHWLLDAMTEFSVPGVQ